MQQEHQLPDDERRDELTDLKTRIDRAMGQLNEVNTDAHGEYGEALEVTKSDLNDLREQVADELADIPEWDGQLVRDLVLDFAPRRDTDVERVDTEITFRFTVAAMGEETRCRYAVAVGTGNEWFHVRRDGDWKEVWRN